MSVEIAWKQNILVTDFHLLKSLLVVFGFGSQAFVCGFSRQNINSELSKVVTDRTFGSAELFGQTSTVWFGPNDRTFFCRTQNFFLYYMYCIFQNGYLRYFKIDKKMKLFCEDSFRQKYSTTFKIVLLVRSGIPT